MTGLEPEYRLVENATAPGRLAGLAATVPGTPVVVIAVLPESDGAPGEESVLEPREFVLEDR